MTNVCRIYTKNLFHFLLTGLLLSSLLLAACEQDDDDNVVKADNSSSTAPVTLSVKAANSSNYSPGLSQVHPLSSIDTTPDTEFHPTSITSGPPEGFKLAITNIVLDNTEKDQEIVTLFENREGVVINIEGSVVDLSSLIGEVENEPNASGDEVIFNIPSGTYNRLSFNFMRKSEIKGCVRAIFAEDISDVDDASGDHTYCTQTNYSTFSGNKGQNADFENKASEWMDFDINGMNSFTTDTTETFGFSFPIENNLVVESTTDAINMTLVIDMNRLLRFYNRGRSDTGPNPGHPTDYSYFFDTTFRDSIFGFAGEPGQIYGYYMSAYACWNATTIPADHICQTNGDWIDFWMTIITDVSGIPIVASFMPDDDNMGIVKGTHRDVSGKFIEDNGNGTMKIKFSLGEGGEGAIMNFPKDLTSTPVGGSISGVHLEGYQDSYGTISILRRQL
jgi:hypothetical protein